MIQLNMGGMMRQLKGNKRKHEYELKEAKATLDLLKSQSMGAGERNK